MITALLYNLMNMLSLYSAAAIVQVLKILGKM